MVLETYTGQLAFSKERSDPKLVGGMDVASYVMYNSSCSQVDHFEDDLKDVELFKKIQDSTIQAGARECQHSPAFYHSLISRCLSRHSRRPTSQDVRANKDIIVTVGLL